MLNKLGVDLSNIIYRYIFQSKINEVNQEFHREFYWDDDSLCSRNLFEHYEFNRGYGEDYILFNWRDMNKDSYICLGGCEVMKMHIKNRKYSYRKWFLSNLNYVYTSTKSLDEIRQNKIACLIK